MENSASTFDQHIPSCVENFCPGASAGGATAEDQLNEIDQLGLAVWPVDFELTGELREEEQKANESVEKAGASDKMATQNSQIYTLLENGDSVMAAKGFDIGNDLPEGVSLNIPLF